MTPRIFSLLNFQRLNGRGSVTHFLRTLHSAGLRLISTSLVMAFGIVGARLLGSENFGNYVILFTIAGLTSTVTSVGIPMLLQREISAGGLSSENSRIVPILQALLIVNVALIASAVIALLIGRENLFLVSAFTASANCAAIANAIFVGSERVILANWIFTVLRPIFAIMALVCAGAFFAADGALAMYAQISAALAVVVAFALASRKLPNGEFRLSVSGRGWWGQHHKAMAKMGAIFAATQVLINLTTQIDIIILSWLADEQDVAHYYAAARGAFVLNFFFAAGGLIAEPTLTRLIAGQRSREAQRLASTVAINGVAVTGVIGIAAVVISPFYLQLYGEDFVSALASFLIFAAGIFARSLFGVGAPILRAARLERKLLISTFFALLVNVCVSCTLVPFLGIAGAAIGSAVQFVIHGALMANASHRHARLRSDVFYGFQILMRMRSIRRAKVAN